jgi:hypothetical protein
MKSSGSRIEGMSLLTPSNGAVVRCMCSATCKGIATSHISPISRAYISAQLTTTSQAISPRLVDTPVIAPLLCRMPVTSGFSVSRGGAHAHFHVALDVAELSPVVSASPRQDYSYRVRLPL